ncbi:MAG: helix-turn-helix domain-containing protein [Nanoarchaeota archaeon]
MKYPKDLEEAIKEKVTPLLEETMEKHLGITIPKLEADITDRLVNPQLNIYVAAGLPFSKAKKSFKKEFLKRELRLHRGNISHLAKTLELDRRSIHRAIKDLDIKVGQIKGILSSTGLGKELGKELSKERYQEGIVDQAIRGTFEQYKQVLRPEKIEELYQDLPTLSRNIVKFIPYQDWTWKDAEREFERQFLQQALEEQGWKVSEAAAKIGIRAETLHRKIRKLGLRKER